MAIPSATQQTISFVSVKLIDRACMVLVALFTPLQTTSNTRLASIAILTYLAKGEG